MLSVPVGVAVRWLMLSTGVVTTDDLDGIGCSFGDDLSLEVAAELVDAVDQGRVADQADTGYALMLAAEITERNEDLESAQVLAGRAVEAYRTHRDPDYGYARAFHAGLLLQLGRADEAMAELTALRPKLFEDADAVSYISEAWESGGRADIAEQWLTEALTTALHREAELESEPGQQAYRQRAEVMFALVQQRHRLRRDLDLPHDHHDQLADRLASAVTDALSAEEPDYQGMALLFWPRAEFDRLLLRWPDLAKEYGQTWDEYRTTVQRTMVLWSETGQARLTLLAGAVDGLADHADLHGSDPTDPQVRQSYAEQLEEPGRETAWPPGRNEACWCGSELKYKKCCLPRGRT